MNILEVVAKAEKEHDILRCAIDIYGPDKQKDQLIEECAELIISLRHDLRGRTANVLEELVDVEIMLEQMKMLYPMEEWNRIRAEKIKRLAERIS